MGTRCKLSHHDKVLFKRECNASANNDIVFAIDLNGHVDEKGDSNRCRIVLVLRTLKDAFDCVPNKLIRYALCQQLVPEDVVRWDKL